MLGTTMYLRYVQFLALPILYYILFTWYYCAYSVVLCTWYYLTYALYNALCVVRGGILLQGGL